MKTNQIMIRPMGEFKVVQRTKDAFFNATELLKQWNQLKGMRKEVMTTSICLLLKSLFTL
nr:MAG: KilA-N domain [Bacteriophage sp.]